MAKPKNYEEALEQVNILREQLKEQKSKLRDYRTENKVKRGKDIEDAKVAKEVEKQEAALEKTRALLDELKLLTKDLKPRKARTLKYEFPADCISKEDRKKYRTKMRRENKKAEKAKLEPDTEVEDKKPLKKKPVKKATPAEEEDSSED